MNSILSRPKAIAGIKIVEQHRRHAGEFFQNKRMSCRDLKWDYLGPERAAKISRALTRANIPHITRHVCRPFSERHHAQIRLRAPLDFSLLEVGGRRLDMKARAEERRFRARFREEIAELKRRLDALEYPGDRFKLAQVRKALGRKSSRA